MSSNLPPRNIMQPFVSVFKCNKNFKRPDEYQGEWPKRNKSYIVDLYAAVDGCPPRVYVQGLTANAPHNSFPMGHWIFVATIWLN